MLWPVHNRTENNLTIVWSDPHFDLLGPHFLDKAMDGYTSGSPRLDSPHPACRPVRVSSKSKAPQGMVGPLPRITDPYHPDFYDITHSVQVAQEKARVRANKEVCKLRKAYVVVDRQDVPEKAWALNAKEIVSAHLRGEADWDAQLPYERALACYQEEYGKFVPDAENAAWFARKAPRIIALQAARAAAPRQFEIDVGHAFSSDDGADEHFKEMAFHAGAAEDLASSCGSDPQQMVAAASEPLIFTVYNVYPQHDPRHARFDTEMRRYALTLEPTPTPSATVGNEIPFRIDNSFANSPADLMFQIECGHADDYRDLVQEKRENPHSPYVPAPALWDYSHVPWIRCLGSDRAQFVPFFPQNEKADQDLTLMNFGRLCAARPRAITRPTVARSRPAQKEQLPDLPSLLSPTIVPPFSRIPPLSNMQWLLALFAFSKRSARSTHQDHGQDLSALLWHCIKHLIFPVSIKTEREDNALNHNSIDRFRVSPIIPPSRNATSPSDHQIDEYPTLNPSFKVQPHSSAGSENDMMHQDVKLQTTQALSSRSRCTTAPQAFRAARISLQFRHRSSFVTESILSSSLCPGSPCLLTTELYPQRNSHTSASVSEDQPSQISARCPQVLHGHSPPRPHYIGTTRQRVPRPSARRKVAHRAGVRKRITRQVLIRALCRVPGRICLQLRP
ncbi:hypothetical protein B0H17DRAFT_1173649 [Mycena rosella]|uniref:Uncharacterized protein n=1 Tax=Mycena rosella TaxID=1033263 RepID=A0AAD7H3Z7_MYCRO|nr:hypothetical protein B0H17DRAFT_1173649 [Mycena rosella]